MKNLLTLLLFILPAGISAQSWNSLTNGKSTYYVLNGSDTLVWNYTARFDTVINGDSVFSLPPYYEICRGCSQYLPGCNNLLDTVYFKTPLYFFPGKKMMRSVSGDWILGQQHFLIKNTGILHQSWLADTLNNLTCEMDTVVVRNILGVNDSVRIYKISNNDSILVGKYFGIISFPQGNPGNVFQLAGHREDGRGKYLPSRKEIYYWQPGDVFYYIERFHNGWPAWPCDYEMTEDKKRYEVLQDNSTPQQYNYQVSVTVTSSTRCITGTGNPGSYSANQYVSNISVPVKSSLGDVWLDSNALNVHGYFGLLQFNSSMFSYPHMVVRSFPVSLNGFPGTGMHNQPQYGYPDWPLAVMDTTYYLPSHSLAMDCFNQDSSYGSVYAVLDGTLLFLEGIGILWEHNSLSYDMSSDKELVGFIKNGVTYGTVPSVSELLSAENDEIKKIRIYSVNGNIYAENIPEDILPAQLVLMDISGKIISEKQVFSNGNIFSAESLPSGIYVIHGHSEKGSISVTKVIIE